MRGGPLVVVGDTLLDVDLHGTVGRVAPDAPVPVVDCQRERRSVKVLISGETRNRAASHVANYIAARAGRRQPRVL